MQYVTHKNDQRILIKFPRDFMLNEEAVKRLITFKYNPDRIEPQDHSKTHFVFALYGKGIKKRFFASNAKEDKF